MEVVIEKSILNCFEKIFSYSQTCEEAAETVVPDTMPDAERILSAAGTVVIRSKQASDGGISVSAGVAANVMYIPEDTGPVRCLNVAIPFEITAQSPAVTPDSIPVAELTLLSVDARMLNPRKIVVRARMSVCLEAFNPSAITSGHTSESIEEADVCFCGKNVEISPVVCVQEKTFVVTDEYRLHTPADSMGELLRREVRLFSDDVRSVGSKLVVKGCAVVCLTYSGGNDGYVYESRFETTFSQLIDTEREYSSPDCTVNMILTASYIEPVTLSGGEQGISCELHIVAQAVCTDTVSLSCISDCYSNSRLLELSRETIRCPLTLRRETLRYMLHESIEVSPAAAEVCAASCMAETATMSGDSVACRVNVCVTYKDAGGALRSVSRMLDAKVSVPSDAGVSVTVISTRCSEIYAVPSAEGLDVRLPVDFELLFRRETAEEHITGLELGELRERGDVPSLTIVRAGEGDTLWELAKRHRSTCQTIISSNDLETDAGITGKIILIPAII